MAAGLPPPAGRRIALIAHDNAKQDMLEPGVRSPKARFLMPAAGNPGMQASGLRPHWHDAGSIRTLRVAGPGQHDMAEIDEPPGCLVAETLVGSGDQRDRHHDSLQQRGSGLPDRAPLAWRLGRLLADFTRSAHGRHGGGLGWPGMRGRPGRPDVIGRTWPEQPWSGFTPSRAR
jgi:hypothetical protein